MIRTTEYSNVFEMCAIAIVNYGIAVKYTVLLPGALNIIQPDGHVIITSSEQFRLADGTFTKSTGNSLTI